jgi:hypothetical protein
MRIAVVGTGMVGRALAGKLAELATNGAGSIAMLESACEAALAGKVLVDVANPLDFSRGMPPSLFVCNTDSLGEQIQRRFPQASVSCPGFASGERLARGTSTSASPASSPRASGVPYDRARGLRRGARDAHSPADRRRA